MRIVIILEKGLVQGVFADAPGCEHAVVDCDTDGVERSRLCITPQGDECTIDVGDTQHDPEYVERIFRCSELGSMPSELIQDMTGVLAQVVASHDNWRNCSDQREALDVWTETVNRARCVLDRVTGAPIEENKEDANNG